MMPSPSLVTPPSSDPSAARRPSPFTSRLPRLLLLLALFVPLAAGLALGRAESGAARDRDADAVNPHALAVPANSSESPGSPDAAAAVTGSIAQADPAHAATRVALPALRSLGGDSICSSWAGVQNIGDADSVVVVVFWAGAGDPGDPCPGPLNVSCTGLLAPGAAWSLYGDQIADGATSAIAFSFNARRLSELGMIGVPDDLVGSYLCTRMYEDLVGQCDSYSAFAAAFASGGTWAGVPLGEAVGSPLAVNVLRTCDAARLAGAKTTATYEGIGANALDALSGDDGGYRQLVAPVHFDRAQDWEPSAESFVSVQNAGAVDASVTIWAQPDTSCTPSRCRDLTIRPGESMTVPAEDCGTGRWRGAMWATSDVPIAVVADTVSADAVDGDVLATYEGVTDALTHDAVGMPVRDTAAAMLFGPLIVDPRYGWASRITVQNLSETDPTNVTVTFVDRAGEILDSTGGQLCAHGSGTFSLVATDNLPGMRVGSVRVTSNVPPGSPPGSVPAPITAVAHLTQYADESATSMLQSVAYRLLPEGLVFDAPAGGGRGGPAGGAAVAALPQVFLDLGGVGVGSELVVTNLVTEPGWTDVAILLADQNGVVDTLCRRVGAGQVAYVDLAASAVLANGLRGSAIVSATYWAHPVPADAAGPARNLVGLAAAALWRSQTVLGQDVPGDEATLTLAQPLARLPAPSGASMPDPCAPDPAPRPTPAAPPPPAAGARDAQVLVPAFQLRGQDACTAAVDVRNAGDEPAQAVLVAWLEPGFCPPECAGPNQVVCSGLLAPGGTWTLTPPGDFFGQAGAALFSFSARSVEAVGGPPGATETVGDRMCEVLGRDLPDRCSPYNQFKLAFDRGLVYADVPLDRAWGPRLEATVTRVCDDIQTPGLQVTSRYAGLPGAAVHALDPRLGGYRYSVVPLVTLNTITWLYIQNAGHECARVDIDLQAFGDCLYSLHFVIDNVAPGDTYFFDPAMAASPMFAGFARILGSQSLAVVAGVISPGKEVLVPAVPGTSPFDLDDDGRLGTGDEAVFEAAFGSAPGDVRWNPRADFDATGVVDEIDREILSDNLCGGGVPPLPDPPLSDRRPATVVMLPGLGGPAGEGTCASLVAVQNIGDTDSGAVLLTWGDPGHAGCVGPLSLACTGLIRPGRTWYLPRDPALGETSGVLYSFTARTLSEIGATPGGDRTVLDAMCSSLGGLVGDCDGYAAFAAAYASGSDRGGVPLDRAAGSALAAHVERTCPGDMTPALTATSRYAGVGANALGVLDPARGGWVYDASFVYANRSGYNSWLHVQNAGTTDATVTARLRVAGDCSAGRTCAPVVIPPGASMLIDPSRCTGPGFSGSVRLTSSGPLAVTVDTVGRDQILSDTATAMRADYDAGAAELLDAPARVLYGPLLYDPEHGWDTGVTVHNRSETSIARVRVEFLDGRGAPLATLEDEVCVDSEAMFFQPVLNALPGESIGSVRATSLRRGDDPLTAPVPIDGMVTQVLYRDSRRSEALGSATYSLVPEPLAMVWPNGGEAGGLAGGIGVIAIPEIDLGSRVGSTELAVANLVTAPGWTDFAVLVYDRENLVDVACRRVAAGHVDVVDLADLALPAGFRGSAVVSATTWQHPVVDRSSGRTTNALGLAAAVVRRGAPGSGGDPLAITAGEPLRALPWPAGQAPGDLCAGRPTPVPTSTERATNTPPPTPTPAATFTPGPSPTPPTPPPPGGWIYLPAAYRP